jgi:cellulose biosynthesis protein BcsQ
MLAEDFARRGLRVVLVDADRQRGAGLLLGFEQPTGSVQQTRNPRLRYLCSSQLPLRELPAKAEELAGLFDVAVVDTPSLDDPLAKAWIQLSTDVLMVLPVEPLSIRTLDGADAALDGIRRLNPCVQVLGTLPAMFNEQDSNHRALLIELMSRRPDGLLSPAIPLDPGLAHRAQQKAEHRTEPSESTRGAYQAAGDFLVRALQLETPYSVAPAAAATGWNPGAAPAPARKPKAAPRGAPTGSAGTPQRVAKPGQPVPGRRPATRPAPPVEPVAVPTSRPAAPLARWAAIVGTVLALLAVCLGLLFRPGRPSHDSTGERPLPTGSGKASGRIVPVLFERSAARAPARVRP